MTTQTPATVEIKNWLLIRIRFFPNFYSGSGSGSERKTQKTAGVESGTLDPVPPLANILRLRPDSKTFLGFAPWLLLQPHVECNKVFIISLKIVCRCSPAFRDKVKKTTPAPLLFRKFMKTPADIHSYTPTPVYTRDGHRLGLDRTVSRMKPILADHDWTALQFIFNWRSRTRSDQWPWNHMTGNMCCDWLYQSWAVANYSSSELLGAPLFFEKNSGCGSELSRFTATAVGYFGVSNSVVRILKFDNPIRSEKFQWYPNQLLIRKFCWKHNPIHLRKSKTIIIPDSNQITIFLPYLLNLVII